MRMVPYPQRDEEPEKPILKKEPPISAASMPSEGHRSSQSSSRKRGDKSRSMFELCKGKPLPFTTLQIADLPYSTPSGLLHPRWEGFHEGQKVWDNGVVSK
ncbi:hypothetical protein B296_00011429 [Ensete ventricosum]|uniref:Uncharacterized protein n=1 Tax=Ensete ventricosum TaxID=4639 RepID=A0A427B619_ENSVE|nr:hypothetical protein B296_00011429 [Ensete ventricosum]